MKRIIISLAAVIVFAVPAAFADIKPCEELKAEIDSKLKEKGLRSIRLRSYRRTRSKIKRSSAPAKAALKRFHIPANRESLSLFVRVSLCMVVFTLSRFPLKYKYAKTSLRRTALVA